MRLKIPVLAAASARSPRRPPHTTYKVRSGDTLSEIAERFNVTVNQLMTWNRLRTSSRCVRVNVSSSMLMPRA